MSAPISSFRTFLFGAPLWALAAVVAQGDPKPETLIEVMPFHSGPGTLPVGQSALGREGGYRAWRLHRAGGELLIVLARSADLGSTPHPPWQVHTGTIGETGAKVHHSVDVPCRDAEAELYVSPAKASLALICIDTSGEVQRLEVDPASGTVAVVDASGVQD